MILLKLIYFFLPVVLANMAPVLLKNHFKFLGHPVDFGKKWKGKELFGSHKTWRGLFFATLLGGTLYMLQYTLAIYFPSFNNLPFNYFSVPIWFGFLFAASAIFGDLIKSFVKRRFNIKSGKSWVPFDQIDFIITANIIVSFFFPFKAYYWLFIIVGVILHIFINRLGYWLKLKNTPW